MLLWVLQHFLRVLAFPRCACTSPYPEDLNQFLRASLFSPTSQFVLMWLVPAQGLTSPLDRAVGLASPRRQQANAVISQLSDSPKVTGEMGAISEEPCGKTHSSFKNPQQFSEVSARLPLSLQTGPREFRLLQTHLHFFFFLSSISNVSEAPATLEETFTFSKGKLLGLFQISDIQGHSQQFNSSLSSARALLVNLRDADFSCLRELVLVESTLC